MTFGEICREFGDFLKYTVIFLHYIFIVVAVMVSAPCTSVTKQYNSVPAK